MYLTTEETGTQSDNGLTPRSEMKSEAIPSTSQHGQTWNEQGESQHESCWNDQQLQCFYCTPVPDEDTLPPVPADGYLYKRGISPQGTASHHSLWRMSQIGDSERMSGDDCHRLLHLKTRRNRILVTNNTLLQHVIYCFAHCVHLHDFASYFHSEKKLEITELWE